jgi:hypothetical protein
MLSGLGQPRFVIGGQWVQSMDKSQIREHMKVVGSDGRSIGSVDKVESDKIKLSKSGSADGQHHFIDMADVAEIKGDEIRLSKNRT